MRILVSRGGQQLGPFSLEELRAAVASGQISQQDLAWWDGAPNWVPVAQVPGFNLAASNPPGLPVASVSIENPAAGLATTSLILGILSLLGLSCLAGIPAIICGHMALARQKQAGYPGSGVAIGGLVTGYAGTVLITIIALLAAIAVPNFVRARERAQLVRSMANAKQIVAACQMYQASHNGEFPNTLDDLGDLDPGLAFFVDPLNPQPGAAGYWYSKPARNAPGNTVVVASRGQTSDKKRALGHKDGSASMGPFTIPPDR
jgi:type II secretory pathway pseudopilin PulG